MRKFLGARFVYVVLTIICSLSLYSVSRRTNVSLPLLLLETNAMKVLSALTGIKKCEAVSLEGGKSGSKPYKVCCEGKEYVIRFIDRRIQIRGKVREIEAQIIASEEGYGPKVYASDINEGWIIMDYLQATTLTMKDRINDQLYVALGECLRRLHSGSAFLSKEPTKTPVLDKIKERLHAIKVQDKLPSSIDHSVLDDILESAYRKYNLADFTPTHGDLNANNIIFVGIKPFLIDFEDAGQDDPFYDLGIVGFRYISDFHQEGLFLEEYFTRLPTREEYEHYQIMKQVAAIKFGLDMLETLSRDFIKNTAVTIEPFGKMLQDHWKGLLDTADQCIQLKIAISALQEAVDINSIL